MLGKISHAKPWLQHIAHRSPLHDLVWTAWVLSHPSGKVIDVQFAGVDMFEKVATRLATGPRNQRWTSQGGQCLTEVSSHEGFSC